eukprot:11522-Heterococcus_DN1.PRE.2
MVFSGTVHCCAHAKHCTDICVRLLSQSYNTVPPAACRLIAECLELTEFIALASTDRRRACLAVALWERERSPKVAAVAAAAAAKASNDKQAVNYSSVPVFRYLDSKHVGTASPAGRCVLASYP